MTRTTIKHICLREEMSIILITSIEPGTDIKGHHLYKDIQNQKQEEQLDVRIEPINHVDT